MNIAPYYLAGGSQVDFQGGGDLAYHPGGWPLRKAGKASAETRLHRSALRKVWRGQRGDAHRTAFSPMACQRAVCA